MNSNIGIISSYAAQASAYSSASQAYLFCISRIDMYKFVQRSIISRRTPMPVKMVVTQVKSTDMLRSGMSIIIAIRKFDVCAMLSRVFEGTYVYIRRNPFLNDVFQIVMLWNCHNQYARMMEPYHEFIMRTAYEREENVRENVLHAQNPLLSLEEQEEYNERLADYNQEHSMNIRITNLPRQDAEHPEFVSREVGHLPHNSL
jgi:hypothetical protein